MKKIIKLPLSILISVGSLLFVAFFWKNSIMVFIFLIAISILALILKNNIKYLLIYILASIGGAIAESIAVYLDAWQYSEPNFAGIPLWLVPLWGIAALFVIQVSEELDKFLINNAKPKVVNV